MLTKLSIAATCLGLLMGPAFSQGADRGDRSDRMSHDDRRSSERYDHDDADRDRATRDDHEDDRDMAVHHQRHPSSHPSFMLQNGNASISVHCGDESIRVCVDAALALLDKAKMMQSPATGASASPEKPKE